MSRLSRAGGSNEADRDQCRGGGRRRGHGGVARRGERGETLPQAVPQLRFSSINQLFSAITEKRLELIRHVAEHGGLNTRQLAQALGRDYKNVHTDEIGRAPRR